MAFGEVGIGVDGVNWQLSVCGFIVGALIGLTGIGGGSVMTPLMILVFHVHSALAVGTDLLYSSITKLFGTVQHVRQRTIHKGVLVRLVIGSVPGAILGSLVIALLAARMDPTGLNTWVGRVLGVVYVVAIAAMLWRLFSRKSQVAGESATDYIPTGKLITLGLVAGFIVGMTSVGSGALYIAVLGVIFPMVGAKMVGTDIVQGFVVTGVAGITHLLFGNVDLWLVASLLIGSIPGILIGSRLTLRVPDAALQACLVIMLGWSSWSLLAK